VLLLTCVFEGLACSGSSPSASAQYISASFRYWRLCRSDFATTVRTLSPWLDNSLFATARHILWPPRAKVNVQVQTSVPRCLPHLGKPPAFGVWVGSVIRSRPGLRMTSPGSLLAAAGRGAPPKNEPAKDRPIAWGTRASRIGRQRGCVNHRSRAAERHSPRRRE
jgi:hypothetical protein